MRSTQTEEKEGINGKTDIAGVFPLPCRVCVVFLILNKKCVRVRARDYQPQESRVGTLLLRVGQFEVNPGASQFSLRRSLSSRFLIVLLSTTFSLFLSHSVFVSLADLLELGIARQRGAVGV